MGGANREVRRTAFVEGVRISAETPEELPKIYGLSMDFYAEVGYTEHRKDVLFMSILHVTQDNFNEVLTSDKTVLLDFFADWCGPCRMIAPFVEEIADEQPQLLVAKINVDEEPELARRFGVMSIPTLVVMKNGEVANRSKGAMPKAEILAMLSE